MTSRGSAPESDVRYRRKLLDQHVWSSLRFVLPLLLVGCESPSDPPITQPPTDITSPTISIPWDTLMIGADTARFQATVRDSGLVSSVGYSYRDGPFRMVEVVPAETVTVELEIPVDEGFHPLLIVASDDSGNQRFAKRIIGATRARLNVFVTDSTELNELGNAPVWQRMRGTAPGMVKLVYWGWSLNYAPRPWRGDIPLGTDPDRTFSDATISGEDFLSFEATDANGVRLRDTITVIRAEAKMLFPPAENFFIDESQTTTELDLRVRAFVPWGPSNWPPPTPKIQRLDLIHPDGDTQSVQITPAEEIAFKWSPRLTQGITRLKVRAEMEGGHVSITSFPVVRVPPPQAPGIFASVAAMSKYTCGIAVGGEIYCWGEPEWYGGRLFEQRLVPGAASVLNELGLVQMTGAMGHSCGIDGTGIAYCWGQNSTGALGDGTSDLRSGPVRVAGDLRFLSIATEFRQTCGIADNRLAYCWGSTANPVIKQYNSVPVEIPGGITFSSIVVRGEFCGVSTAGEMYCWHQWTEPAPRRIPAPVQLVQVTEGTHGICALDAVGDVWCLQSGTLSKRIEGYGFTSLSGHCGLTSDSRAYCWGDTPVEVAGGLRFRELSVYDSGGQSCGVTLENAVYCWGYGVHGQLGNGSRFSVSVPIRVRDPAP